MAKGKGNGGTAVVDAPENDSAAVEEAAPQVNPQDEIMARDLSSTMGDALPMHDLANLFPPMTDEEYRSLKLDISENGQLVPIYTSGGKIIDGRHRYKATRELGITPNVQEWQGNGSLTNFVVALNLNRRHLTTSQRAAIALAVLPSFEEEARERMLSGTANPTENMPEGKDDRTAVAQAGRTMNVSGKLVQQVKKVQETAPDLLEKIASGEMTVNKALNIANDRPNADGSPKPERATRQTSKPPANDRIEGALYELYDYLGMWVGEYGNIPTLKEVAARAKAWIPELQALEAAGADAGTGEESFGTADVGDTEPGSAAAEDDDSE